MPRLPDYRAMQTILKIAGVVFLAGLSACDSGPQQHATFMPGTPDDGTVLTTPSMNSPSVETAQAPSANGNAVPPPNGVVMPTAAPPVPAYGDPTVSRTPYFYPPVGMGVHVPR